VCGKGAPAAAVTAMARWTLRSFARSTHRPADALRSLNDSMLRQDLQGRFITIAYVLLRVGDGEARATIACAGHPPAIFVSAAGEPSTVPSSGDLLGIWPDIRLAETEQRLGPGESIVLYTDGVTDQGPGTTRSPERALRTRARGSSANELADALHEEADTWGGTPRDDLAIVALRFSPDSAGEPRGLAEPALTAASARP
jgi:sigma-B regulation protein RsbU (phosphoserine phosphatase)